MIDLDRHSAPRAVALAAAVLLLVAACSQAPVEPSPPGSASPDPSTRPSSPPASPSLSASVLPTIGPAPTPTASSGEACAIESQTGRLPSDRMTDVVLTSTDSADVITFVFGDPSLPNPPQGPSEGLLELAEPPYVEGASGLPMDIEGERVVFVRFTGMSIVNDVGQLTYDGPTEFRPDSAVLRTVANSEQFEGVVSWYIGFEGPGCVQLSSDARSVTVSVQRPPA